MPRLRLSRTARLALITYLLSCVFEQAPLARPLTRSLDLRPTFQAASQVKPTGLLTNRLSPKDLSRWKSIERLVFAEDADQQPLHPTLRWMWQWLDASGHAVHIELVRVNPKSTCTAGNFSIERFDPRGESHIAVINLNLPNIDLAYVGPRAKRSDGFTPFTELDREERYAEVLGHEMSHAIHILTSFERAKTVVDDVDRTNHMLLTQHVRRKSGALAPELRSRLSKRDELLKQLEKQAEYMEKIVWKELHASKRARQKTLIDDQ